MWVKFACRIITSLCVFNVSFGALCNRVTSSNSNCENIYVWRKDRKEFISLLNVTLARLAVNDLKAFEGKTIRVIVGNFLPYITYSKESRELSGFLGDIWNIIGELLKFESNITSMRYDVGLETVSTGRADVMLSAVVSKEGLINIEYSQPYFYNWYHLYIKQPIKSVSSFAYIRTLDSKLWFASLMLFLILTMSVWLTTKFLNSYYQLEPIVSIPTCFLTVVAGFINQGFDSKLTSYSCRIQVMFALLLGLLLYSAMNAVLVAKLAILNAEFPFTSLDDVAKRKTHSMCVRNESFVYNNFTDSNHTVLPKWRNIVNGPGCLDINEQSNLAKIICNEKVVFLENRVIIPTIQIRYQIPCEIINLDTKYFEKYNSFLMLRGLDKEKSISLAVNKLKETGILRRFENKWIYTDRKNTNNYKTNQYNISQVTIRHIYGILFLYGVMMLLSVIILIIERSLNKRTILPFVN